MRASGLLKQDHEKMKSYSSTDREPKQLGKKLDTAKLEGPRIAS
jgi:hypothetical protein